MKTLVFSSLLICGALFAGAPSDPDEVKATGGFLTAYSVESQTPAPQPTPPKSQQKPLAANPTVAAEKYVKSVTHELGGYLGRISTDLAVHERQMDQINLDDWVKRRMVEILNKTPGSMTAEKLNYLDRCVTPVQQVQQAQPAVIYQGGCRGCGS